MDTLGIANQASVSESIVQGAEPELIKAYFEVKMVSKDKISKLGQGSLIGTILQTFLRIIYLLMINC